MNAGVRIDEEDSSCLSSVRTPSTQMNIVIINKNVLQTFFLIMTIFISESHVYGVAFLLRQGQTKAKQEGNTHNALRAQWHRAQGGDLAQRKHLYPDSRSLIQHLQKGPTIVKTGLENKIWDLLKTITTALNTTIYLRWISGHCGIPGNEEDDHMANQGA